MRPSLELCVALSAVVLCAAKPQLVPHLQLPVPDLPDPTYSGYVDVDRLGPCFDTTDNSLVSSLETRLQLLA